MNYILPMAAMVLTLFAARAELERAAEHARLAQDAQVETQGHLDAFLARLDAAMLAQPPQS